MYHGICLNWHCEAPEGPRQSRKGGYDIADGFPVIQAGTARLPRRLRLLAMTIQGNAAAHLCPFAIELSSAGRSVSALQAGNIQGVYVMA